MTDQTGQNITIKRYNYLTIVTLNVNGLFDDTK